MEKLASLHVIEENGTILKQIEQASKQEGSNDISHQRAALPVSSSSCDLFGLCFHSYLPENCPIDKKNEGSGTGCYTMMSGKLWLIFF